jgi:hypothetical protein
VSQKPKTGRRSASETRRRSAIEHIRVSICGLAHPTFRVETSLKTTVESARGLGEPEGASLWQNLHENRWVCTTLRERREKVVAAYSSSSGLSRLVPVISFGRPRFVDFRDGRDKPAHDP